MTMNTASANAITSWLKRYYGVRALVSALWVALAFTLGDRQPLLAIVLLVAYPTWDALANFVDAQRSGGLGRNLPQLLNFYVSIATTVAVTIAVWQSMNDVLFVFGVWAGFSGALQLITGIRRWTSYGAQWAMILSGAQSVLAGVFMVRAAGSGAPVGIANIAPYAAFGAFYFLVSAVWLIISEMRKANSRVAQN